MNTQKLRSKRVVIPTVAAAAVLERRRRRLGQQRGRPTS